MTTATIPIIRYLFACAMLLLIAGCGSDSETKSHTVPDKGFASNIRIQAGDIELIGKFYYEKGRYRIEFPGDTLEPVQLVDENKGFVALIFPIKGAYKEFSLDEFRSFDTDLFQTVKLAAEKYSVNTVGQDTLYGMPCVKQIITKDSLDIYAQWVSDEYPFPLRIEEYTRIKRILELFGMAKVVLGDVIFSIPENYTDVDKMNFRDESTRTMNIRPDSTELRIIERQPPIKELVIMNDQLEVKLDATKQVTIRFKNGTGNPADCQISFYRDGQVLSKNENGPNNYGKVSLKGLGSATKNTWKAYADKFVARIDRGKMFIEVTQPGAEL